MDLLAFVAVEMFRVHHLKPVHYVVTMDGHTGQHKMKITINMVRTR